MQPRQPLLFDLEKAIREERIRHMMIEQLPILPREKQLLIALDQIAHRSGTGSFTTHEGQSVIQIGRSSIAAEMGTCVKTWLRAKNGAKETRFLTVEESDSAPHIFKIEWRAIFAHWEGGTRGGTEGGTIVSPVTPSCPPLDSPLGPKKTDVRARRGDSSVTGDTPPHVRHVCNTHVKHVVWKYFLPKSSGTVPGWPRRITPEQLRIPEAIFELYAIAVHWKNINASEQTMLDFFATAHRSLRADVPGAAFTTCVKKRLLGQASNTDEQWASEAIKLLRRPEETPIGAQLAAAMPAIDAPYQTGRDQQLQALKTYGGGKPR